MEDKCTNPELGLLLHSYELGILPEEEASSFEVHLLDCDQCFRSLQALSPYNELLRHDENIRSQLLSETSRELGTLSLARKLGHSLWPNTSWFLRPGIIYSVLAAAILLACLNVFWPQANRVHQTQHISLLSTRSASPAVLRKSFSDDGAISFAFRGAERGRSYGLVLIGNQADTCLQNGGFSFDNNNIGHLLLPLSTMRPGEYRLLVASSLDEAAETFQEYRFLIVP